MILGVGTDLCVIDRIRRSVERFGDRFLCRVFTEIERTRAARRPDPAARLAQSFAAKEACTKALGTGLRKGVFLRDIGVRNLPTGQPVLELTGGALGRLQSMVPDGMEPRIDVSLTDDGGMAHAIVVIWAASSSEKAP